MSQTESHVGRLVRVPDYKGMNQEETILAKLAEKGHKKRPEWCKDTISWLKYELGEEFFIHQGLLYRAEDKRLDDDEDVIEAKWNPDGSISYAVTFYNGGCSFGEAVEEALGKCEQHNDEFILVKVSDFEEMTKDVAFLRKLQTAGVDNWDGYDEAFKD